MQRDSRRHLLCPSNGRVALFIVWVIAASYLTLKAGVGWIPHDEGLLGQSAERVLAGELPHRDFDNPYTGGLACMHAIVFRLLGVDVYWFRVLLLLFALAFVPILYSIAVRVVTPALAGVTTLMCVAWSLPNYFAALPSWYNLFFSVFGTWALLHFAEQRHLRWLFLAGLFGGLSVLFKIIGVYYVAAAFLFLLYVEQDEAYQAEKASRRGLFPLFTGCAVLVYLAALVLLISRRFTPMDVLHFIVPSVALAVVLLRNEWRLGARAQIVRWRRLGTWLWVFGLGVTIPVALFSLPYVFSSSLGQLVHGVLVLPQQRLDSAAYPLPELATVLAAAPLAALLLLRAAPGSLWERAGLVTAFGLACGIVALCGQSQPVYAAIWWSVRPAVPLVVLVGCSALLSPHDDPSARDDRRPLTFLLLAMAATVSLVQYPYAFGIYFCYAAPVVILACVGVAARRPFAPHRLQLCLLGLYLVFGVLWLNRGYIRAIGVTYVRVEQDTQLALRRARLCVPEREARLYEELVAEIQRHSHPGSYIYATSDCPEMYFLAARANPTRTFYDFFDADFRSEPGQRVSRIMTLLEERDVKVVVLRWYGEFSGPLSRELLEAVPRQFPNYRDFWYSPEAAMRSPPDFTVAWRD